MNAGKLLLLILPALPAIISDLEAVIKDASEKGVPVDQKVKDTLDALVTLISAIGKLL